MPRLSVIIPVYNDEKAFEKCLTSVFQSDFKDFEVVVVNDASTDNSLAVAKKFPCRIIDLKTNAGVANARNQGANAAKADILVFFDSDVVIEKDTLSKFAKNHENSNIKVCQCQIRPKSLSKGFAPDLTAILWRYVFKRMGSNPSYVSTMAFSIDKKVFNEIGQFNTFFESAGGEEFEIGTALKNQNYKIFFDQSFSIYHHFQYFWPRFKTLFRRSYLYGRIFLDRKFEFDKGHGTFKEGINSLLSLAGIFSLFLIPFSPLFLLIFPSTILLQLFLDLNQNSYIAKKRGFLFFLLSIPLNYAWYFSMSLGVSKAVLFHYSKKFFSPFRNFSFLFSNTPPYVIFFVTANCNARC